MMTAIERLGCHSRRAQRARSGIQSKTSILELVLDSPSGPRPAGDDAAQAIGACGFKFERRAFSLSREAGEGWGGGLR